MEGGDAAKTTPSTTLLYPIHTTAVTPTPPPNPNTTYSGYLWKKGTRSLSLAWKRRWFVLRPTTSDPVVSTATTIRSASSSPPSNASLFATPSIPVPPATHPNYISVSLYYYKDESEYEVLGSIALTDIVAIAQVSPSTNATSKGSTETVNPKHPFLFALVTTRRTYYLETSSMAELSGWMNYLSSAWNRVHSPSFLTIPLPIAASPVEGDKVAELMVSSGSEEDAQLSGSDEEHEEPFPPTIDGKPLPRPSSTGKSVSFYAPSGGKDTALPSPDEIMSNIPLNEGHAIVMTAGVGKNAGGVSGLLDSQKTTHQGYLEKRQSKLKVWKRRWVVLRGGRLWLYKNDSEYSLHSCLELANFSSCNVVGGEGTGTSVTSSPSLMALPSDTPPPLLHLSSSPTSAISIMLPSIPANSTSSVSRYTFVLVSTLSPGVFRRRRHPSKIILAAESEEARAHWVSVLQKAMNSPQTV